MLGFLELGLVSGLIGLRASIFWLWMLIDAILNPRLRGTEKLFWVLVILLLYALGALAYFSLGRGGSTSGPVV